MQKGGARARCDIAHRSSNGRIARRRGIPVARAGPRPGWPAGRPALDTRLLTIALALVAARRRAIGMATKGSPGPSANGAAKHDRVRTRAPWPEPSQRCRVARQSCARLGLLQIAQSSSPAAAVSNLLTAPSAIVTRVGPAGDDLNRRPDHDRQPSNRAFQPHPASQVCEQPGSWVCPFFSYSSFLGLARQSPNLPRPTCASCPALIVMSTS
jgi:hypothetical protein